MVVSGRAEGADIFKGAELCQPVEGRFDNGGGILGTKGLGEDVAQADNLEDGADATAGDQAGTRGGRAKEDDATIAAADDFVGNGIAAHVDGAEGAMGALGALADGIGDLLGLAVADADAALAVTSDHEGGEVEATTTLGGLAATVDVHDLLVVGRGGAIIPTGRARSAALATRTRTPAGVATGTGTACTGRSAGSGARRGTGRGGVGRGFAHEIVRCFRS